MMTPSKNAVFSISAWGNVIGIVTAIVAWYGALPPDLVSDTYAFLILVVTQLVALWGRWRASLPLSLFPKR